MIDAEIRECLDNAKGMAIFTIIDQLSRGMEVSDKAIKVLVSPSDLINFDMDEEGGIKYPDDYLGEIERAVLPKYQNSYDIFKEKLNEHIIIKITDGPQTCKSRTKRKVLARSPGEERPQKSSRDKDTSEDETSL